MNQVVSFDVLCNQVYITIVNGLHSYVVVVVVVVIHNYSKSMTTRLQTTNNGQGFCQDS